MFQDLNSPPFVGEDFQTNLIMPEPTFFLSRKFPPVSIIRPTNTQGADMGAGKVLENYLIIRRSISGLFWIVFVNR